MIQNKFGYYFEGVHEDWWFILIVSVLTIATIISMYRKSKRQEKSNIHPSN